jgi:hypothetical protein
LTFRADSAAGSPAAKSFTSRSIPLALALPFQITPLEERREVKMREAIRIVVGSAALAAALAFFVPSTAQAQVRFYGRFPLPHGSISVGVGDPYYRGYGYYGYRAFPVGSYVPYGYRVIYEPTLGYGFYSPAFYCGLHGVYHSHWVPVRSYGARYIVVERPFIGGYSGRYDRPYSGDRYYGRDYGRRYSRRDFDRRDFRRWDRRDPRRWDRRDFDRRNWDPRGSGRRWDSDRRSPYDRTWN